MWFDNNILIHRFCGYLTAFYAVLHTVGHLLGTIRKISSEKDISKANAVTLHYDFDHTMTYSELLFTTLPGVTGIMLLVIILVMAFTSMKWFRNLFFQTFAHIHLV